MLFLDSCFFVLWDDQVIVNQLNKLGQLVQTQQSVTKSINGQLYVNADNSMCFQECVVYHDYNIIQVLIHEGMVYCLSQNELTVYTTAFVVASRITVAGKFTCMLLTQLQVPCYDSQNPNHTARQQKQLVCFGTESGTLLFVSY